MHLTYPCLLLCLSPSWLLLQAQLPPGTPPVHDLAPLAQDVPPAPAIRRSHSLDSCMNSLTGLLDQLALGQLCGSEEGTDDCAESESWTMADTLSADMEPWFAGAATAAAGGSSSSNGAAAQAGDKVACGAHAHLQPVQEVAEESC